MTTILVIVALILAIGVLAMFYEMRKQLNALKAPDKNETNEALMAWLKDMRESQSQNTEAVERKLSETNKAINERLDRAATVMQSVGTEVGKMQEIGQSMKELQAVLKSPKLRGNLGEQGMKDLLEQMLPKAGFKMQYKFKSGDTVDAVVKTKNGLIPIDSKFPMENYLAVHKAKEEADRERIMKTFQRDIKLHIDKIAKKYILPAEDTIDFAIMYVPGESVFYEIVANTDLCSYAADKKVLLVSPNTFYYMLRTVMIAFEGEKIEERAKQVMTALQSIRNDSTKLGTDLGVLNRHVTNAKNTMEAVHHSYSRLGSKIENTGRLGEQTVEAAEQLEETNAQKIDLPETEADEAIKQAQELFQSKK